MSVLRARVAAMALGIAPGAMVGAPLAFLDGPPPAFTGGFGEPTCRQCHSDVPAPDPAGAVAVRGLPARYLPGARYVLTVRLGRPEMVAAGFQLSARGEDGSQAGTLRPLDERAAVRTSGGVQYAGHTRAGTVVAGDSTSWRVEWTAPRRTGGSVRFHLAGNAADGDESQLGDHVYTATKSVDVGQEPRLPGLEPQRKRRQ